MKKIRKLMRGRVFGKEDEKVICSSGPPLYKKTKQMNLHFKIYGGLEDEINRKDQPQNHNGTRVHLVL